MSAISANKAELLAIANAVASEKMIDKSIVIEAMVLVTKLGFKRIFSSVDH